MARGDALGVHRGIEGWLLRGGVLPFASWQAGAGRLSARARIARRVHFGELVASRATQWRKTTRFGGKSASPLQALDRQTFLPHHSRITSRFRLRGRSTKSFEGRSWPKLARKPA